MPVDIQATGFAGIAFEAVAGTYVAPTKFFPIRSESLKWVQEDSDRRVIRAIADRLGRLAGPGHVEGDIEIEGLHDILPYFLYASRNTVVKSGAGPYTYTTTPTHGANPTTGKTLSITIVRNGQAFGYTGCVVGSMRFSTDNDALTMTFSIYGRAEATQSVPTPTFSTVAPMAAGMYTIGNPTGSTVTDVDQFELTVEDNASSENRLTNTVAATYTKFGERNVQLTMTRDFQDRTEYDAFKTLTARSVRVNVANGAHSIQFTVPATIKSAYDISGLSSQGDLVMAEITYEGPYDTATSKAYEFIVVTTENIV